jgi:argininosuccinate lyase
MAETTGKQVTWGGRFAAGPSALMQRFSESVSFDARLAPFDLQGSRAHARMLGHVGLLSPEETHAIVAGLDALADEVAAGGFPWDPALEDVHMNLEQALTARVPAAAKLHTARSRNDQIATDMRLWFRHACEALDAELVGWMRAQIGRASCRERV